MNSPAIKHKNVNTNKVVFYSIIFITFVISTIAFQTYFENGWYVQDDYISIEKGGAGSIFHTATEMTSWLYSGQARFQPVRIFFFSIVTHLFQEEYAPRYNFALHLINLLLLFFLLRKFNVSNVNSLITILVFSLFGRYRMMESPSVMIGGSGLNLFFILITLIFLIKALEESNWSPKKIIWLGISITSYVGLTFSYEVAFPLFLVVIYTFIIFNFKGDVRSNLLDIRRYFPLLAYLAPLFIYFIFFRHTESSYEGASVVWNYDILTRLKSYLIYTLTYPIKLKAEPEVILFFGLYFFAISLALKVDKSAATNNKQLDVSLNNYKLFAFGVIFYLSSLVLFILNQWVSPTSVMRHHTYLMTAGSAIIIVSLIIGLQHLFIETVKEVYYYFMILVLIPLILAAGLYNTLEDYKGQQQVTATIKLLKYKIQSSIADPAKIDAILIKNFSHNYYGISGMDGAYLQWFGFKKYIHSGREIISILDNEIKFRGPLTYYHPPNEVYDVDSGKMEIFYLSDVDKKLLTYSDSINFKTGENFHQLDKVMSDGQQCDQDYILNAIFKNLYAKDTLVISLSSESSIKSFLEGANIEINGRVVKAIFTAERNIYINGLTDAKYIFLKITSTNNKFKKYLSEIKLSNNSPVIKSTRIQINDVIPALLKSSPSSIAKTELQQPTWEWGTGFYELEKDATHNWRWASPTGDLFITNTTQRPLKITFEMNIGTSYKEPYVLLIKSRLWNDELKITVKPQLYIKTLIVPPGKHIVRFESNAPKPVGSADPRFLSYIIENFRIVNCISRLEGQRAFDLVSELAE